MPCGKALGAKKSYEVKKIHLAYCCDLRQLGEIKLNSRCLRLVSDGELVDLTQSNTDALNCTFKYRQRKNTKVFSLISRGF